MSPWLSDLYLGSQSDARLLSLTRDGHARAFAILAVRYRVELLAHARRLSANGNAEDVVQQTFLSAFAALAAGAEVVHPRGWLHAILRHAAVRAPASVDVPLEESDASGEPLEAFVERRARVRSVLAAMDGLPSRQRQALVGSSLQGLSRTELASSLGISEGAVRQLVHRARLALRSAITAFTPYPLARWLAAAGSNSGTGSELAMTAGAASAGGLMAKVGVFAAAGAIATGIAVQSHPAHSVRAHRAHPGLVRTASAGHGAPAPAGSITAATSGAGVRLYASDPVTSAQSSARAVGRRRPDAGSGHRDGSASRGAGSGSGSRRDSRAPSGDRSGDGVNNPSSGDGGGSNRGSGSGHDAGSARTAGSDGSSGSGSGGDSGSGSTPASRPGGDSGSGSHGDSGPGSGSGSSPSTGSDSGSAGSTNGGGGSGPTAGPTPSADPSPTGSTTTIGQGSRDLWPPIGSSPVQDH
ncbi:MAG: RNA polymerase sigma factor [Solirubrobacteraceae bacterium]